MLPGLTVKGGFTRHPFDEEYGVYTSGLIAGRHLKSGHTHDRHNTAYYGVAPSVFHALLKRWQKTPPAAPINEFTFIDVGAGMGRAMLLAALLPFREVIGVELHPTLARFAQKNLSLWQTANRAQSPMRIVCGDAVEFKLPAGPCVTFLFNPFGATVMRRLLSAWNKSRAARPAPLDLLYVNHEQECILEQQTAFTRLFRGPVPRSKADAIADYRILANQPNGKYASSNHEDCSIYRWLGKPTSGRKTP